MSPEAFANGLRARIREQHGGNLPSAGQLASALNRVDDWRRPVSTETMRRWIRGLSLPELHRVPTLCAWLDCEPGDLLAVDQSVAKPDPMAAPRQRGESGQSPGSDEAADPESALRERIAQAVLGMSREELAALVVLLERSPADAQHPRRQKAP